MTIEFEYAMRCFFGEEAYGLAGSDDDPKTVRKWLLRAVKKMAKNVNDIDTSERHRELLLNRLNSLERNIRKSDCFPDTVWHLFWLCSALLGYDFLDGKQYHTPAYYQTPNQHFQSWRRSTDASNVEYIQQYDINLASKRKEIIQQLKKEGYSDFHISFVMGISEYMVKKIRRELD